MAKRFDTGEFANPQVLSNGWLRADALLTRTGVFEYRLPDGKVRRELRLPEEVFKADALDSFAMVPLTDDHPAVALDASNTKQLAVGHVGEMVKQDGQFVRAKVLVTDGVTVKKLLDGEKQQLSCGYTCDVEEAPGIYKGLRYDAIQRNIRGNHVALVAKGRAGPDVRIRLDASDGIMQNQICDTEAEAQLVKIRIDGVDFEGSEQLAQAMAKRDEAAAAEVAKQAEALKAVQAEAEKAKARADALEAELAKQAEALKAAQDPAKLREAVKARVGLEKRAAEVLGSDAKLDGMDERAIKVACIQKVSPDAKLDGASDAYVDGRFDSALELAAREKSASLRTVAAPAPKADAAPPTDSKSARERMLSESRDAWKKPLSATR